MKLSEDVDLNLQKLIVSRMLVQANSGAGKSWALRRILEQTHGEVQQIVIDAEDEFYTLREKYDYILVRKEGGDCVPEVRSAGLLAHRLLELGVSAIISIFEMKPHERIRFAREFLDALVNAPKKLWHPAIIVVDEAHVFCPEKGSGEAESSGSVIDLMTRGRKRGFCGVLATQRISKLNKDAAAEANNKLIGRCALDLDMKRGGEELGFVSKDDRLSLRLLKPGEFFGFGPAISDIVIPVKIGGVETTHPKAGGGVTPVAPPKHKVQSVLVKLADLPQEAEEERASVTSLQQQVRELKRELAKKPAQPAAKVEVKEKPVLKDGQIDRLEKLNNQFEELFVRCGKQIEGFSTKAITQLNALFARRIEVLEPINEAIEKVNSSARQSLAPPAEKITPKNAIERTVAPRPARQQTVPHQPASGATGAAGGAVEGAGVRRIAAAIAQRRNGAMRKQLTTITGLKRSTRDRYLQHLTAAGYASSQGDRFFMTDAGLEWLGNDYEQLPTGVELQRYWINTLPGSQSAIFKVVLENPDGVSRDDITDKTGLKRSTRDRYIQYLQAQELVTAEAGSIIKPAPDMFE